MDIVLFSLLAVVVLYFIFAFLPWRICAICGAVSLVWVGLLLAYFFEWHSNLLWISIMMGGSVVGFMYKLEKYFKQKTLSNFWLVRILIIVLGFLSVYLFLEKEWDFLIFTVIIAIILGFLSLFFIKNKKSNSSSSKFSKELTEKLDHCCD